MVRNKAPQTQRSVNDENTQKWAKQISQQHAKRARWRTLPFFWAVTVCAVVFPVGLWSGFDIASLANPAPAEITAKKIPHGSTAVSHDSAHADVMTVHLIDANHHSDLALTVPSDKHCTVKEALDAAGVALNHYDRVTPKLDVAVKPGMTITLTRVSVGYHKRYVTHEPETRYQLTTSVAPGKKQVKQYQRTGREEITERVWMKNGKITLKEITDRKAIRKVQDKVVYLGVSSALMPGKVPYHNRYARSYSLSARGGSPRERMYNGTNSLRRLRSITLHSTAYSDSPSENGGWSRTATGMPIVYGVAAVDPRVIPLGTRLYVEGYGYAFACDTGGAIKGHRIDLAMSSSQVYRWGRRTVKVWILGP